MGNTASTVEVPGGGTDGYCVLQVHENSPGAAAGLEPFFDYIIAVNGVRLNTDSGFLKKTTAESLEQPMDLLVYSSKDQSVRQTKLTPRQNWGGSGLLGISIRFCSFEGASERVWHILDVQSGSPAAQAGLQAHSDYVVASDRQLEDRDDFFDLVEESNQRPMRLFVYNVDTDSCREVTVTPNDQWGGSGFLGCGIGYGYLHRIPERPRSARQPANTLDLSNMGRALPPAASTTHAQTAMPSFNLGNEAFTLSTIPTSPGGTRETAAAASSPAQASTDGFTEVPLTSPPTSAALPGQGAAGFGSNGSASPTVASSNGHGHSHDGASCSHSHSEGSYGHDHGHDQSHDHGHSHGVPAYDYGSTGSGHGAGYGAPAVSAAPYSSGYGQPGSTAYAPAPSYGSNSGTSYSYDHRDSTPVDARSHATGHGHAHDDHGHSHDGHNSYGDQQSQVGYATQGHGGGAGDSATRYDSQYRTAPGSDPAAYTDYASPPQAGLGQFLAGPPPSGQ